MSNIVFLLIQVLILAVAINRLTKGLFFETLTLIALAVLGVVLSPVFSLIAWILHLSTKEQNE
jgi:hypothetical protein